MNQPGPGFLPAILIAVLMAGSGWLVFGIVRSAGEGVIRRNGAVGLRLKRVMSSDDSWRHGHRAATPAAKKTAFLVSGLSLASIAGSGVGVLYLVLLGLTVVGLLGGLILTTRRAVTGVRGR